MLIGVMALLMLNPVAVFADGISDAMQKVINVYPNSCSYFTSDGNKDSNSQDARCSLVNIPSRGGLPSGKTVRDARGGDAWSCHGFAEYVWYVMFGHCINTQTQVISASALQVGDFIRFSGHSAIYLGEDSQNYYVYDSNWASPADNKVRYNHTIKKSRGIEACYHATNYDEIAGKTPVINNPFGYLDSCSGKEGCFEISGWAKDEDEPDSGIEIHVYIGGPFGSAETEGHSGIYANQYRSDVGKHAYTATIKTNRTGVQYIYIYGINVGGGENTLIATGTVTIMPNEAPKISNVRVENLSSGGYTVRCDVSDNVGVASVKFPSWTTTNGQDDIKWHEGVISGNTAECRIDVKDHNNETNCFYITHIYAADAAGNESCFELGEIYIDSTPPIISNVKVTNVNENGFDITCKIYDDTEISKVQFPAWTKKNGQDDLIQDWKTNVICSGKIDGDIVSYHVDTRDHNNEKGLYYVHIYAYDKYGNRSNLTLSTYVGNDRYETAPLITKTYNGHVYMLFEGMNCDGDKQMDWSEAASYCQSIGGRLVCITSEEENKVVASMVNEYGSPCWIGGNDLEQEGNFVWESGETFDYTNWDAGEPNNAGEQDFIRMYTNGLWDDVESAHYAFICEFESQIYSLAEENGILAATVLDTNSVKEYGFVYSEGEEVTLETPGRTRIAYSELDSNNSYSLDVTKLTGCTIRAYVVYNDENGEERVEYSEATLK